ncbi:hypothetical protein SAMN05216228_100857 [Rhizobium tibeticum]|uniref:Uncharacterized protein n=1 Tax=Rhizobium tibeticum TaxID=501024 RepID=A0A1H8JV04_9HYPH|nr:hypothetical protein [Rhizobium tibeticum]SEH79423.1 hypothetical protein RTCCBAU85039_2401 [Rhizobium tibeticum]SEN84116.1 hypothetical protein SAMN05216228_100857 [Rhizobium tibeticum]
MNNVIDLAEYRSRKSASRTPHERELALLKRALAAMELAKAQCDADELADWCDELEVLALYTEHFDVRERCKLALRAG